MCHAARSLSLEHRWEAEERAEDDDDDDDDEGRA